MKYLYGTAVMATVLASARAEDILANEFMTMMARATSTSEVLTLNLTNLLILIVLKAIIFGFGLFSVGATARSAEESSLVPSRMEATGGLCFIQYMAGDDERLSCVQRAVCEDVSDASQIVMGSKLMFKAMNVLGVPVSEKYTAVYNAMNDAQTYARAGGDCSVYQWPTY